MSVEQSDRVNIIKAITSPLGLYALAFLIMESMISLVLTTSKIPPEDILIGLYIGAFLFIFTILVVTFLALFNPKALTYDKETHEREAINELQAQYDTSGLVNDLENKKLIRGFWKKDGVLNQQNEGIIVDWMRQKQINTSITLLLHENKNQSYRAQLIDYLNSKNCLS